MPIQSTHQQPSPIIAIGIDCGTSGVRAVALDQYQQLLIQVQHPLQMQTPKHWWLTCQQVLDDLFQQLHQYDHIDLQHSQLTFSLDATSSSLFLVDRHGQPSTPAMMYYDACPQEANQLTSILSSASAAHGQHSSLAKALYLQQHYPQTSHFYICHQADWLLYHLTGKLGISDENNSLKLGYDPINRCWESTTCALIGEQHLPQVLPPATPIAPIRSQLCQRWQLPQDTLVSTGTTDSVAAFIATQANTLGDGVIALGSSLAFKLLTGHPVFNADQGIYSHRLWDQWLVGGASNAGGACLLEHFDLTQIIHYAQRPLHSTYYDPNYYPLPKQAQGERFPWADPSKRYIPFPQHYSQQQQFDQLIAGLVYIEQQGWLSLSQLSQQPIQRVISCGGGQRNWAWQQQRHQQLPYSLHTATYEEAAVGAAILALKALTGV